MKEYFKIHCTKSRYKQKKVRIKKANKKKEILSNILTREDFLFYKKNQFEEQKAKKERARQGLENGVKIIIDCSYEKNMMKKEITSLCKQICLSCAAMKKSENPLSINLANCDQELRKKLVLMGSNGWALNIFEEDILHIDFVQKTFGQTNSEKKELMKEILPQNNDCLNNANKTTSEENKKVSNDNLNDKNSDISLQNYLNYKIKTEEITFNDENKLKTEQKLKKDLSFLDNTKEIHNFPINRTNIIYLSPDSENTLQRIEKNHFYIIGGMVDKTIKKNLSLEKAQKFGLNHAKLPINQFLDQNQRKPLNIDTVVHLISEFLNQNDWERSFYKVCPTKLLKKEQ